MMKCVGSNYGDLLQRSWAEPAPGPAANSGAITRTRGHCPRRAGTQGQAWSTGARRPQDPGLPVEKRGRRARGAPGGGGFSAAPQRPRYSPGAPTLPETRSAGGREGKPGAERGDGRHTCGGREPRNAGSRPAGRRGQAPARGSETGRGPAYPALAAATAARGGGRPSCAAGSGEAADGGAGSGGPRARGAHARVGAGSGAARRGCAEPSGAERERPGPLLRASSRPPRLQGPFAPRPGSRPRPGPGQTLARRPPAVAGSAPVPRRGRTDPASSTPAAGPGAWPGLGSAIRPRLGRRALGQAPAAGPERWVREPGAGQVTVAAPSEPRRLLGPLVRAANFKDLNGGGWDQEFPYLGG